jgi:hypothetical protein
MPFDYTIKAHPTRYKGVLFRSRLEAQWAAFFDLCRWRWKYEPIDLEGWTPDFYLEIPCNHSSCAPDPCHRLYVEVKPAFDLYELRKAVSDAMRRMDRYNDPSPAMFGIAPDITDWEMCHGEGGGCFSVKGWKANWRELWVEAGNITQWKPR